MCDCDMLPLGTIPLSPRPRPLAASAPPSPWDPAHLPTFLAYFRLVRARASKPSTSRASGVPAPAAGLKAPHQPWALRSPGPSPAAFLLGPSALLDFVVSLSLSRLGIGCKSSMLRAKISATFRGSAWSCQDAPAGSAWWRDGHKSMPQASSGTRPEGRQVVRTSQLVLVILVIIPVAIVIAIMIVL